MWIAGLCDVHPLVHLGIIYNTYSILHEWGRAWIDSSKMKITVIKALLEEPIPQVPQVQDETSVAHRIHVSKGPKRELSGPQLQSYIVLHALPYRCEMRFSNSECDTERL